MAAEGTGSTWTSTTSRASMGPRPDGRGRMLGWSGCPCSACGFNGAAAGWPRKVAVGVMAAFIGMLQWGRGRMAAEGLQAIRETAAARKLQWGRGRMAAEGHGGGPLGNPMRLLQWGRGRMAAEGRTLRWGRRPPCPRFNGAAAGWPRKDCPAQPGLCAQVASMGPRPDGRGRRAGGPGQPLTSNGFNGAAAGWPRKGIRRINALDPIFRLQWGRGRMAAEGKGRRKGGVRIACFNGAAAGWPRKVSVRVARGLPYYSFNGAAAGWPRKVVGPERAPEIQSASMGPRPDGRGRQSRPSPLGPSLQLQWGRGRMAAEGFSAARRSRPWRSFNGAAAGWPRKDPTQNP